MLNVTDRVGTALAEWRLMGTRRWLAHLASGRSTTDFAANLSLPFNGRERPDPTGFGVVVPVTGGLDSTTLWAMVREAGLPYRLVYFDMGQEYASAELAAVQRIMPREHVEVIDLPLPFIVKDWVLNARNAAIIIALADWMTGESFWGEIWFGNTQGEGPITGGDKSHRFLNDAQHLLTLNGYDVRLCSPLAGWEKDDTVRWWMVREPDLATVRDTRSCFAADTDHCGQCVACFRRASGMLMAGVPVEVVRGSYPNGFAFGKVLLRYRTRMSDDRWEANGYSPHRRRMTLDACDLIEAMETVS